MANPNYSMYEIITMTPGMAGEVLCYECMKDNPDMELIRNILEHSQVDVNWTIPISNRYRTPLEIAVSKSKPHYVQERVMKILLNTPDAWEGCSAAYIASIKNHTEIVELLEKRVAHVVGIC